MSTQSPKQLLRLQIPHLQRRIRRSRDEELTILRHAQIGHLSLMSRLTEHIPRRRHQLPQWLPSAHAPDDQLARPSSGHRFLVLEDRRDLCLGVQDGYLRRYGMEVVDRQVEGDEVGLLVEGVLEAGDDVSVVLGQVQVTDLVSESDATVVLDLAKRFVAEDVPDDDRRSSAVLLCPPEYHSLSVTHQAAGGAQLVLAHLQRSTGVEVPELATNKKHINDLTSLFVSLSLFLCLSLSVSLGHALSHFLCLSVCLPLFLSSYVCTLRNNP